MKMLEPVVRNFVRHGFVHKFGEPVPGVKPDAEWRKLRVAGTRLWLDTGDADEAGQLWNAEFDALTTNNTLLNKEIQKGGYDGLVVEAAKAIRQVAPKMTERDLILEIAFILNARHALSLVSKFDAMVSVELHTDLADDVARTEAFGRRFHAICHERFIVKVPLTPAGCLGARRLAKAGIPVNFTLGFSARQNHLAALLAQPAYVNVFMGRLNAFVADNKLGSGQNVGEKATLATQRTLNALRAAGETNTHLIGASVRSGAQIADCAGVDVLTMPPKAAAEYRANPRTTIESQVARDPDVPLAPGVSLAQFNGGSLWDVTEDFASRAESLLLRNLDALTPEALQTEFPDVFPRWSAVDIETATKDGKIPVFSRWQPRLASGEIGLDALMNLSALQSFVTDQRALDDRIRSLVAGKR